MLKSFLIDVFFLFYINNFSLVLKFSGGKVAEVCPQAFARAHLRGHTYYDKLVRQLKEGATNGGPSAFSHHSVMTPSKVRMLMKTNPGLKLTPAEFTAATLPNTLRSVATAAWMTEFFRLTGERKKIC